ncbi:MAG TPA: transcriptional repressor [Opitutaceae bacterium]|nr:transcriptional repressor [Opitutaceae bacterium]
MQQFVETRQRVHAHDHMPVMARGARPGKRDERIDTLRSAADISRVSINAAREKFKSYLADNGLRVTNQRLAIFDAAFAQKEHFTAEGLLDRARAIDDSVSRATVYRTLPIMTESSLLREVDIGAGEKYYVPNRDNATEQAQVICLDCDKIFEISAPFMEWYGSTVSSKLGLTPVSQRLQVNAHCDVFRQTGACKNRN